MSTNAAKKILKEQLQQYFPKVTPAIIRKAVKDGKLDNDLEIYQLANAYLDVAGKTKSGYSLALEVTRNAGALDILAYSSYTCTVWKRIVTLDDRGHMIVPDDSAIFKDIREKFRGQDLINYTTKIVLTGEDFYELTGTYGGVWAGTSQDAPYLIDKEFPACSSHRVEPGRSWSSFSMTFDGTVHLHGGHLENLYVPAQIFLENFALAKR